MVPPHIFMLNDRLPSHLFCLPLIGLLFILPNTLSVTIIKTTDVALNEILLNAQLRGSHGDYRCWEISSSNLFHMTLSDTPS